MISRKRAWASLDILVDRGLVTPDQSKSYGDLIRDGTSYKDLMVAELGIVMGHLYIAEEEAQKHILHGLRMNLSFISVPEALLSEEDMNQEPWHLEHYSELRSKERFEAEAGEPWHLSLRERFRPDPKVVLWFHKNKDVASASAKIVEIAYRLRTADGRPS